MIQFILLIFFSLCNINTCTSYIHINSDLGKQCFLKNISTIETLSKIHCKQVVSKKKDIRFDLFKFIYSSSFYHHVINKYNYEPLSIVHKDSIIERFFFIGNKKISKKLLLKVCKRLGIKKNSVLNIQQVKSIKYKLQELYNNLGILNAKINIHYQKIKSGNFIVKFFISEGPDQILNDIQIIGNKYFSSNKIISLFQSYPNFFQRMVFNNKKYQWKLFKNDLEKLQSFYLQQGYINFCIKKINFNCVQNNKNILVTIVLSEGKQYKLSSYVIHGNLLNYQYLFQQDWLKSKLNKQYNSDEIGKLQQELKIKFLNLGFLQCNIDTKIMLYNFDNTVIVHFYIDLGPRCFIKNIIITENKYKKNDYSLLYCIKNMVIGSFSNFHSIQSSIFHVKDIDYFKHFISKFSCFDNRENKSHMISQVKEKNNNNFDVSLGYNLSYGPNININFNHKNWLGLGENTNINFIHGKSNDNIDFSFKYPHYRKNIIFINKIFYHYSHHTGFNDNILKIIKKYGSNNDIEFMFSPNYSIHFGVNYFKSHTYDIIFLKKYLFSNKVLKKNSNTLDKNNSYHSNISVMYDWSYNSISRKNFPTSGHQLSCHGKFFFNSNNDFYHKLTFIVEKYFSNLKNKKYIFHSCSTIGFGRSLNKNHYPKYENFGLQDDNNIRGLSNNSIHTKFLYQCNKNNHDDKEFNFYIKQSNESIGGNNFFINKFDIIFPIHSILGYNCNNYVQASYFLDFGSLWDNYTHNTVKNKYHYVNSIFDIHASTGFELVLISPFGPVHVIYVYPFFCPHTNFVNPLQIHMSYTW
ncbi:outer membrane protein assembly factor BamA [Buchnera aphidicola]|uniref:outer membrane protein assembly factor BamA n=1 Tax=Buchnera aphidicola TaxID=9 RepID=UPI0031B7EF62